MAEVCVAIAVVIGLLFLYASLTARRLDRLHSLVAKSRRALEQALTARAQYARDFAASGGLDIASAIVLAESAESCLHEGMRPIVPDGFYTIDGFSEEPADAAHGKKGRRSRRGCDWHAGGDKEVHGSQGASPYLQ